MSKHEQRGEINFYNCDCMEFMKTLKNDHFDLAITDPPYGIEKQISRGGGSHTKSQVKFHQLYSENHKTWDVAPDKEYFKELFRVSKHQIIWGANYFEMPKCRCFVFWDKCVDVPNFSAGEYAWTSFDKPAIKIAIRNTVEIQKSTKDKSRIHPTQKPIKLYRTLLKHFAQKGWKILDTHGGSFSHAIACDMEGLALDICEIDTEYFKAGLKRFDIYKSQSKINFNE